jgi:hypothetical protein
LYLLLALWQASSTLWLGGLNKELYLAKKRDGKG